MSPFWPSHFTGAQSRLVFTTWNTDGLWVDNDEVRNTKLTYLQYLMHNSAMVFLQEVRMDDTDILAFQDWLQRQAGGWHCEFSCVDPRAMGVALLWQEKWQGRWRHVPQVVEAGSIHAVLFYDEAGFP